MKPDYSVLSLVHPGPEHGPPLIELENVTKTYRRGDLAVEVLHGVSLSIYAGELVAIIGPSGSGKTSLMNILGCLDRPTTGAYRFMGEDVSGLDTDALSHLRRDAFGFVFQSYNLISNATAVENVEVPAIYSGVSPQSRHSRAQTLLGALGLAERLEHRPNQLSGGQQQRVSLARALMNGGRILLADEPTGALDSASGAEVMALLRELSSRGHTIILITHSDEIAAHAHRVIEIKDGRIVRDPGPRVPVDAVSVHPAPFKNDSPGSFFADGLEAAKTAARALRANLFRTALTLLGIVIGVAAVIAMLAVGNGAKKAVVDQIKAMGTNLLLVRPGSPNRRVSSGSITTLVPEDAEAIARLPNVLDAVPVQTGPVAARFGSTDYPTGIVATWSGHPTVYRWPLSRGTFFSNADVKNYATVAVLGQTVANNLFPDGVDPIGKYILLNNLMVQVIGVLGPKGADEDGEDQDDNVFVPHTTASVQLLGHRHLHHITIAVDNEARIDETEGAVKALLKERHHQVDFRVKNRAATIEAATEAQNTLTLLLGSIAAVSLLVGGIGVMNIMLVSVTERTREIGIRMAIGARMRNILQQFLTEALAVSALGGLIGVGVGIAAAWAFRAFGMPVQLSLGPVLLAFGCAFITGLAFGYMPARKAARVDPAVALAAE
ncbi:MAG: MacB family efflux pump subunit [Betaproteobacteria bacterium]|nr:MacB family efflux pump subunit [Betaproteobacteria bacterium]